MPKYEEKVTAGSDKPAEGQAQGGGGSSGLHLNVTANGFSAAVETHFSFRFAALAKSPRKLRTKF